MVRTHAPADWDCQFCRIARGEEIEGPWVKLSDIVYRDDNLTAFLSPHWWCRNEGHVLIIPNAHHENLYDIPDDLLGKVAALSERVALAMKQGYGCDGTSMRQHNEPAGGQDMWHYHLHVFPRYEGDDLYQAKVRLTTPNERQPYADRLRSVLMC